MPGWDNDVAYFGAGIDTRGVTPIVNQMDGNGKLLISSAIAPHIRAHTLDSAGGTVAITNGPGTINLEAGGTVAAIFTAEDASTCTPVASNLNIVGTATNGINTRAAGNTMTVSMASPYADGNFVFENTVAATPRAVEILNSDTDGGSYAAQYVTSQATGGDAFTTWEIAPAARFFSMGIDNSDSDFFKFTHNVDPSSGNDIFKVDPAADTFTHNYANIIQTQNHAAVGINTIIQNTNNTNIASDAFLRLDVGGTSAGDPFIAYLVTGAGKYAMGIDNTVAGDPFKITDGNTPSDGTDLLTMSAAGVITLNNDLDVSEGGTGVSTLTSHGVLLGNGAGDIQATAEPSDGQILIGDTGGFPILGTLTAGTNISITNAAGSITVNSTSASGGLFWETIGVSGALVVGKGYMCNAGAALTFSLPAVAAVGTEVALALDGSTSWAITQAANQQIRFGNLETTLGAGGSLTSSAQGDTVRLVCVTANLRWVVVSSMGNILIV